MKWLLVAGVALAIIVVVALVIGYLLPVGHTATRQVTFAVAPETVWQALTDVDAFPSWRTDVQRVERLPDRNGQAMWVEEGKNGRLTFVVEQREPPTLLVTRIADPSLPFGGTWTYRVTPTPAGSTLAITEDGEIYNPLFRVMARFVFGYEATMQEYLASLGKRMEAVK